MPDDDSWARDQWPRTRRSDVEIWDRVDREHPMYYSREGKPITMRWWYYFHRGEHKRVAQTTIGPLWISTVYLGMDHGMHGLFGDEGDPYRPLIFESMVFQVDRPNYGDTDRSVSIMDRMAEYMERNDAKLAELHPELRDWIEEPFRYSTEAEAIAGHDKICIGLRVLMANIQMAQEVEAAAIAKANNDRPNPLKGNDDA